MAVKQPFCTIKLTCGTYLLQTCYLFRIFSCSYSRLIDLHWRGMTKQEIYFKILVLKTYTEFMWVTDRAGLCYYQITKQWVLLDAISRMFIVHNTHSLTHRCRKTSCCGHSMSYQLSLRAKLSHPSLILTNFGRFLGLLTSNIHLYKILSQCIKQVHRLIFLIFFKFPWIMIHL